MQPRACATNAALNLRFQDTVISLDRRYLEIHLFQARGVGEEVDHGDLAILDCEGKDDARLAARSPDSAGGSVDERQLRDFCTSREEVGDRRGTKNLCR